MGLVLTWKSGFEAHKDVYQRFARYDRWTPYEALFLLTGIDPDKTFCSKSRSNPEGVLTKRTFHRFHGELIEIYRRKFMKLPDNTLQSGMHPNEWIQWVEPKGLPIPPALLAALKDPTAKSSVAKPAKPLYSTIAIAAMRAAVKEFWLAYDQFRPPKKEMVVAWLIKKYRFSEQTAKAIDLVIRPDPLKKGGNKRAKL